MEKIGRTKIVDLLKRGENSLVRFSWFVPNILLLFQDYSQNATLYLDAMSLLFLIGE